MWNYIKQLFSLSKNGSKRRSKNKERHLEAEYWPEVVDFMDLLNEIIDKNTIHDPNIEAVNRRIIEYIADQINIKGAIEDVNARYSALDILADRILVTNLGKIVGLRQNEGTKAEFSDAIEQFKQRLHQRHQQELIELQKLKN